MNSLNPIDKNQNTTSIKPDITPKSPNSIVEVVKEALSETPPISQKESSWWDWVPSPAGVFEKTVSIGYGIYDYGKGVTVSITLNTLGSYLVGSFDAQDLLRDRKREIEEHSPGLFLFAKFAGESISKTLWPSQLVTLTKLLKEGNSNTSDPIINFIDQNSDAIGEIIKINIISIVGDLGKSFSPRGSKTALADIFTGITQKINKEIEQVSKESVYWGSEEKEKKIQESIQKITDEIINAALPDEADSLLLPDFFGQVNQYAFSFIKNQIGTLIKGLYDESFGKLNVEKEKPSNILMQLTGLKNINALGSIPSTIIKDLVKGQLDDEKAFQHKLEEIIPEEYDRKNISAQLANAFQTVYRDKNSISVGEALSKMLDTNFMILLSKLSSKAMEGQDKIDPKELLSQTLSYWLEKAKEFAKPDSQPIAPEEWNEFLKDFPLPSILKDTLPSLLDTALPQIKTNQFIIPNPTFQKYIQSVGTIIEETIAEGEKSKEELKTSGLDKAYSLSSVVDYSKLYVEKNQDSLKQTFNKQIQNVIKDDVTREWITDNILSITMQAFDPDNVSLNQTLTTGLILADGFLAKTINTLNKNYPETTGFPILPGFIANFSKFLESNPVNLTLLEMANLKEALGLKNKIAAAKDEKEKQKLIQQMHLKAAPLLLALKNLSNQLFELGDLSQISFLKTIQETTLPQMLFDQFGEMAVTLLEWKENEDALGPLLCAQCESLAKKVIDLAKQGVDFKEISQDIAQTLLGSSKNEGQLSVRQKLAGQLEAVLSNQDDPAVWNLATRFVRAALMQSMVSITKGSKNMDHLREQRLELAVSQQTSETLSKEIDSLKNKPIKIELTDKNKKIQLTLSDKLSNDSNKITKLEKEMQKHVNWQSDLQINIDQLLLLTSKHDPLKNFSSKIAEATQKALNEPPLSQEEVYAVRRIFRLRRKNLAGIELDLKTQSEEIKELKLAWAKLNKNILTNPLQSKSDSIWQELKNLEFKQKLTLKGKATVEKKIEDTMKPLLGRFQAISDVIIDVAGWGDTMPVPEFIKATLKEKLLPTFLYDQSADIMFLHTEKASITNSLEKDHKNGQGLLELGKFATAKIMDIIKSFVNSAIVDGKALASEINVLFDLKLTDFDLIDLANKLDSLENKNTIEVEDLFNIIKPYAPTQNIKKSLLVGIKTKITSNSLNVSQLGELVNGLLASNNLPGLSESQKKNLEGQIRDLLKSKQPTIAWDFLNKHIELVLLKVIYNLGKKSPKDDVIVTTTKQLMGIFNKLEKGSHIEQFKGITDEILALSGINDNHPIPGLPLALQKPLLSFITQKAPQVLLDFYEKKQSIFEKPNETILQNSKNEILVDKLVSTISNVGTEAAFNLILNKANDFSNLIQNVLPQGGNFLADSLSEAWDIISADKGGKDKAIEGLKGVSKNFIKTISADLFSNMLATVKKENLEKNINIVTQVLEVVTKILNNQVDIKFDKGTDEIDSKVFFENIVKEALDVVMPKGVDSTWMKKFIPEELQKPIWDALKNTALPELFKSLVGSILTPEKLRGVWLNIFQSINSNLEAPITFKPIKVPTEVESLVNNLLEGEQTIEEKESLANSEQLLNQQCGKAFIAVTKALMPDIIAQVSNTYAKSKFEELVGSSIRGHLTESFWKDLIMTSVDKAIENKVFAYSTGTKTGDLKSKTSELKAQASQQNKAIDKEIHKTMDLLYGYPLKYVWAKFQSKLDSIFAFGGKFGEAFKHYLDIACRFVFITVIGTVIKLIVYPITSIRKKILHSIADKKRASIRNATENLLDNPRMQREVFAMMWNIFFHPKETEKLQA